MSAPAFAFQHSFAESLDGLYVEHAPRGFPAPALIELNRPLLKSLGLPALSDELAAAYFSGSALPEGARPIAQAYAGHQFGHLSPQLGDGRAVLLGEIVDAEGRRFDIQLKGSGRTPFSRGGDGKATLGPVLREYLVSEAMANLGVSTSRVLAAVSTGEQVRRDWMLPGAVLARVAASHLRVGSLEFLNVRGEHEGLKALVDYALKRHYPARAGDDEPAVALLHEVAAAQAKLIASWMHVGFIHGVMNTDNVTLCGETIDYGPCAFLERYDAETVFSSIDRNGRYAFGNQPSIGVWNMLRMTEALLPLLAPKDQEEANAVAEGVVGVFREHFNEAYLRGMHLKIGIAEATTEDVTLLTELMDWMTEAKRDFTLTFRNLSKHLRGEATPLDHDEAFAPWAARWLERVGVRAVAADAMDAVNPLYIPRNHLVEEALERAHEGDMAPFRALMKVLEDPYTERDGLERYAEPAPTDFGPYKTFCGT